MKLMSVDELEAAWLEFVPNNEKLLFLSVDSSLKRQAVQEVEAFLRAIQNIKVESRDEQNLNNLWIHYHLLLSLKYQLLMFLNLEKKNYDLAWGNLVDAEEITEAVAGIILHQNIFNRLRLLHSYELLFFPPQVFNSISVIILSDECSICSKPYAECSHEKGKLYMGEMCKQRILDFDVNEISIVDNPKDKRCRMLVNLTGEDTFTLLPSNKGKGTSRIK